MNLRYRSHLWVSLRSWGLSPGAGAPRKPSKLASSDSLTLLLALLIAATPVAAAADTLDRDLAAAISPNQNASFHVHVDFTQTGGNFGTGTGTATVSFTLENTSGLYSFASGYRNPVLTSFDFNVPSGTGVVYTEARVLAGATEFAPGNLGSSSPASCTQIVADDIRTSWYTLQGSTSAGSFGIFSNELTTAGGINEGLVDPAVITSCVKNGDVMGQAQVAGQLKLTLSLSNLGSSLDSANDFLSLCSTVHGSHEAALFAGHFQGAGNNGQLSGVVADAPCPTPVQASTWGSLKLAYR